MCAAIQYSSANAEESSAGYKIQDHLLDNVCQAIRSSDRWTARLKRELSPTWDFFEACSPRTRRCGIAAMGQTASLSACIATDALPHVIKALKDDDWRVWEAAVEATVRLVTAAPGKATHVLPHVSRGLKSDNVYVR